ncbi:MAG TPA: alpha/beta fold hydrolase [Actinomycetospora sp.]|uniref:alpha/beta fold hydrolase n=1 Tax=Actinomycetospora sp. TaxID=1872135 RepID=UPI002F40D1DB
MTAPVEGLHRYGVGEPLVLLHGASMSWRAWRPVLDELERHHDVIALTMNGHRGGDPWPDGVRVGVPELADSVCARLDALGVERAHVAGNSLGGWVALELVRRGRALSCVALSPAGTWKRPRDLWRLVQVFRLAAELGGLHAVRRAAVRPRWRHVLLRQVMEHGERVPDHDVEGFFDDLAGATMIGPLLAGARPEDALADFDDLPCPVRVAWAEHDHVVPWARYGAPMLRSVRGADFVRLPGCGHVPMWDDPELVARAVLQVTSPA